MAVEGRKRAVIESVLPEIDGGRFPAKRVTGETVTVSADVFADGHDAVRASLLYSGPEDLEWRRVIMEPMGNDRWSASFTVGAEGRYRYTVEGWVDHFLTWKRDLKKKHDAGLDIAADLLAGAVIVEEAAARAAEAERPLLEDFAGRLRRARGEEGLALAADGRLGAAMEAPDRDLVSAYGKVLSVVADPPLAGFSAWYERFPRGCAGTEEHGTFRDCEAVLPEVARMGFDVFYLPPIHPIGRKNRKGRNNAPRAAEGDVGSPWAIGADEGGHREIHPDLGTMEDFERFVARAREEGLEVAMDLAFQCTPDHPWVKKHPQWFRHRPDGSIQHAENPPKKYEDIYPLDFESEDWQGLWGELRDVVLFWLSKGIRIFRVDNPHTKPFAFWEWLIGEVKGEHPGTIFLAEAFTRPRVMHRLAKLGFTQSYTYFTWRTTKSELTGYLRELTETEAAEYFRPNFWPNTPDILPEHLQFGGRPAFVSRLVLAATLSSNYGIYGPAFDLLVSEAVPGKEEYLDSEKYEIRKWDWDSPGNLKDLMARLNRIRRENPALHRTRNLSFLEVDNDFLLFFSKESEDGENLILVLVNTDPHHVQSGWVRVPLERLGIPADRPFLVHDLLSDDRFIWNGERNYVELNPHSLPAHILRVHRRMKREADFDYYM